MKTKPFKYQWVGAAMQAGGPRRRVRHLVHTLAWHMNADGSACFPGTRLLAEEMGVSRSTVHELVEEAKTTGWLRVEERRGGRRGGTYHVYLPLIPPESGRPTVPLDDDAEEPEPVPLPDRFPEPLPFGPGPLHDAKRSVFGPKAVPLSDTTLLGHSQVVPSHTFPLAIEEEEAPPSDWAPPPELRDFGALYRLLDAPALRWAYGRINGPPGCILPASRDLGMLGADDLRALQYHAARTRQEAA